MTLYNKIRIIFLVSFLFLSAFFGAYFYIEHEARLQEKEKRYMQASLYLHKHFRDTLRQGNQPDLHFLDETVKFYLDESDLTLISNVAQIENIEKKARVIHARKLLRSQITILQKKNQFYLVLDHPKFHFLLLDKQEVRLPWEIVYGYLVSLFFLFWLYVWLTRSLKPLRQLQEKIEKVATGDLAISLRSDKKDEIAAVSNAFDDALRKIESLIHSRQLFLRTIMHELKTPIGKGRILNAFLEKKELKEGYDEVFERLELLLHEFSKIEQMLSSNYVVQLQTYQAKDLIEQALEIMILDEKTLEKQVTILNTSDLMVHTDFTLFSLALKNLIDNGLKYAFDHAVEIQITQTAITVASKGEQFTDTIEEYYKPFHGKGKGLGLGLYIVYNITQMLKLGFVYRYAEGKNIFTILINE